MTHSAEKYEKELEELELKAGGVFAVPTPAGHKKRWERKKELVLLEIAAASTPSEKQRLELLLDELERNKLVVTEKLALPNANRPNQPCSEDNFGVSTSL